VRLPELTESLTGRGVRVAIIDSGVNPSHPHVGRVAGGVRITPSGESADWLDYLGHGTAVAGAIREKAPDAELYAVKVFDRKLVTATDVLLRAIEWAADHGIGVLNLSLGIAGDKDRGRFAQALDRAAAAGLVAVSAAGLLPGSLPSVIAVELDRDCPRDTYHQGAGVFYASGYPRPIPGVPQAHNLNGISFAVANMTGFVARALEASPGASADALRRILAEIRIR